MFWVAIEPECQLLHIRVEGFWTPDIMTAYRAELHAKVSALADHGGCRRILVDMSRYPIQAKHIAEGHARIIAYGRDTMRATIAVVMTSSLSRLQARRIADLGGRELFDDEASARTWLLRAVAA